MKASEYRRQVELQLEQAQENALESEGRPTTAPIATVVEALAILRSADSSLQERLKALQILKAASFDAAEFADRAAEFHSLMQKIATDGEADAVLRRDALEILVSLEDDIAREVLWDAIRSPNEGAVSVPVALSLLARDDHGAAVDLAREVLSSSESPAARAQAVRILGTVPEAAEELSALLRDKDEAREVRKASAVALRSLSPDIFDDQARRVLEDNEDFPEIRATLEGVLKRAGHEE